MPHTIELPRPLINQLLHCAQSSPDVEVCGLIGAGMADAFTLYPIKNIAATPAIRFQLDGHQQIDAMRRMRERNERMFAIFHSHPTSPAEPSELDLEQMSYPDVLYLIVSLNTKGVLEMRGFALNGDRRFDEVDLLLKDMDA